MRDAHKPDRMRTCLPVLGNESVLNLTILAEQLVQIIDLYTMKTQHGRKNVEPPLAQLNLVLVLAATQLFFDTVQRNNHAIDVLTWVDQAMLPTYSLVLILKGCAHQP